MTPDLHALIRSVFLEVVPLPSSQRAALLDQRCEGNAELRAEVEKLLTHHDDATLSPLASSSPPLRTEIDRPSAVPRNLAAEQAAAPASPDRSDRAPGVPAAADAGTADWSAPGRIIEDRYRIVSLLGQGGMGSVYRAHDITLNQPVAIKFLADRFANHREWKERFRNEVRLARVVTHPNVCRVFDIGETNGHTFLSMEFVAGEDLSSLLRRTPRLPFDKAVDIARQVCTGLAAAHGAGVLHRDLKPANVMVNEHGQVRLTDFGVAIAIGGKGRQLRAGTPAYMAPEQIAGRRVGVYSDIYALGLVLYELFSGEPAFRAESVAEYQRLHEEEEPRPLASLVPDLEPGVEQLVHWCLQKDPNERPPSALSVAAGLPGVDVLSVALAADQLPAPELVAAASGTIVRVNHCGLLTLFVLAACAVLPWMRSLSGLPWEKPGALPAGQLRNRATQTLAMGEESSSGRSEAFGYCPREQAVSYLERNATSTSAEARADPEFLFWFRVASYPLVPQRAETLVLGNSRASLFDPPIIGADERAVLLDQDGRLIAQIAGGDSVRGDPVPHAVTNIGDAPKGVGIFRVTALLVTFVSIPFAWRNYRSNRGDRVGALRTSILVFVIQMAAWLVGASHVPLVATELALTSVAVLRAFGYASVVMILYLALEPLSRRYWPHMLIGWNRLLAFRGTDALVRQHILLGAALGCFWALLFTAEWSLVTSLGWPPSEPFLTRNAVDRLVGGRAAGAAAIQSLNFGLVQGLLLATPLAMARAVFRKPVRAAIIVGLLFLPVLLPRGAHFGTSFLFLGGGIIATGLWAMIRYGLLAIVVASTIAMFLNASPLGLSRLAGGSLQSAGSLFLVSAVALWAWTRASQQRSRC